VSLTQLEACAQMMHTTKLQHQGPHDVTDRVIKVPDHFVTPASLFGVLVEYMSGVGVSLDVGAALLSMSSVC
jgi:hypothetical protein